MRLLLILKMYFLLNYLKENENCLPYYFGGQDDFLVSCTKKEMEKRIKT